MLLWSVRQLFPQPGRIQVIHFNQINALGPPLRELGSVLETCYQPGEVSGQRIGNCVNEDMCRLSLPDNQFDLAIHSETLEHLIEFEKALSEVSRVLKPGGVQIYTIPLIPRRRTRQRIKKEGDGRLVHCYPPSYHGNESEFPVVWEFGGDFIRQRQSKIAEVHYDNYWANKTVFTIVERKV